MASIDSIKASDGVSNASVATVQNTRSPGASTIIVDTVVGINLNFMGTMGTPHTFTDPITSEEITVISEATAVDFKGHVDGSNLEIDTIAPGYTDAGSAVDDIIIIRPTTQWAGEVADILEVTHNDDGTLKSDIVTTAKILDDAVTAPKIVGIDKSNLTTDSNPYKFRAYRNAAANTGNNDFAVVACDTEAYDTNNNLASGVYTAPVTGFYHLYGQVNVNSGSARDVMAGIFVNGSLHSAGSLIKTPASSNCSVVVSALVPMTAGDTAHLGAYGEVTLALNVGNSYNNYFGGFLISRT